MVKFTMSTYVFNIQHQSIQESQTETNFIVEGMIYSLLAHILACQCGENDMTRSLKDTFRENTIICFIIR